MGASEACSLPPMGGMMPRKRLRYAARPTVRDLASRIYSCTQWLSKSLIGRRAMDPLAAQPGRPAVMVSIAWKCCVTGQTWAPGGGAKGARLTVSDGREGPDQLYRGVGEPRQHQPADEHRIVQPPAPGHAPHQRQRSAQHYSSGRHSSVSRMNCSTLRCRMAAAWEQHARLSPSRQIKPRCERAEESLTSSRVQAPPLPGAPPATSTKVPPTLTLGNVIRWCNHDTQQAPVTSAEHNAASGTRELRGAQHMWCQGGTAVGARAPQ